MSKKLIKEVLCVCFSLKKDRKSKIIYYHDVFSEKQYSKIGTPLSLFQKHMQIIWENKFNIVPNISNPNNEIMICFDDGFRGIYDTKDFFIKNKIFPTVFLATNLIGKENYLNVQEILELQSLGFIFQSHGCVHSDLTKLDDTLLYEDLSQSKILLSDLLKKEVDSFCFPIGFFSKKVHRKAIETGYKYLYTSIPGNYFDNIGEKLITRNLVQFSSAREFKAILWGGNSFLHKHTMNFHYKQ